MQITSIKYAELKPDGTIRIVMADTVGSERKLELTKRAEEQLLTALISAPPAQLGETNPRGILIAENCRLYSGADGMTILEVFLTPKASIHIALPTPLPERLKNLLDQEPKDWAGVSVN
jgi:hypothetical protein